MVPYVNVLRFPLRFVIARNACTGRLPRLPVPPLKDTLSKYLRSVKPLLSKQEYLDTEGKVSKFGAECGEGEELQKLLQERAQIKENWLEEWWTKVAYLEFRSPVVYFSSPGLVFPKQTFKDNEARLMYAAKLITAAIDYKLKIDGNLIPQEKQGKSPLDMAQYKKVFGTYRTPHIPGDKLEYHPKSRYIIVMHHNNVYKLNVLTEDLQQLSVAQLISNLEAIVEMSGDCPAVPVGILTSDNRDSWAQAYENMIEVKENERSLKVISGSLFVLCLDQPWAPKGLDDMNLAGHQCMHGGGSKHNGGNRWYDKTIQFIIGTQGHVGLSYEHSPAEGQPIAVMMDHVVNYITSNQNWTVQPAQDGSKPEKLLFCLSDCVKKQITQSAANLDFLVDDCESACFKFTNYGKEFIKKQKLSPDSYLQMAMQYAFYRLHKEPGAHYESAATRMFKGGRTETIRSCSLESVKFAITMLNGSASIGDKVEALRDAVQGHREYTMQAVQGLGVDRHLLGLKMVAIENGISVPDIYSDVGYTKSTHFLVSTSQVASRSDGFMVYGPLVKAGYACCYNPRDEDVNFGITAHKSCPESSAARFRDALEASLMDMHNLFMQRPGASKL